MHCPEPLSLVLDLRTIVRWLDRKFLIFNNLSSELAFGVGASLRFWGKSVAFAPQP
jgi:hypothetical protein